MTSAEEARVRSWNETLAGKVTIASVAAEDERSGQFEAFCRAFTRVARNVSFVRDDADPGEPPGIRVGSGVRYHAIPSGKELEPFLEAVTGAGEGFSPQGSFRSELQKIKVPAFLSIFISPQCPFCPQIVRQLVPVASANEVIHLSVVDGALFPEMAEANGIQSVPTVLLDEQFRWTGSLPLEELIDVMENRDPVNLGSASLENMLKQGDAGCVAQMMVDRDTVFPSFLPLLTHEKWPVRLGAMVTLEEIAARHPGLAARVIEPLWRRFHEVEDPVKGDILYMMGESGHSDLSGRLEKILEGPYCPDVKEAAEEALEKLRGEADGS